MVGPPQGVVEVVPVGVVQRVGRVGRVGDRVGLASVPEAVEKETGAEGVFQGESVLAAGTHNGNSFGGALDKVGHASCIEEAGGHQGGGVPGLPQGAGAVGSVEDNVASFHLVSGVLPRRVAKVVALDLLSPSLAPEAVDIRVEVACQLARLGHVEHRHDGPGAPIESGDDGGAGPEDVDDDHGSPLHVVVRYV